jgi:hypothetical protein
VVNNLYCNASHNIKKLQRVQTVAARLVVGNIQIPATDVLSHLHWLLVVKLIHFKITTLTHKVLSIQQPTYRRSLINYHVPHANFDHRRCPNFISHLLTKTLANALSVSYLHTFMMLSQSQLDLLPLRSRSSINLKHSIIIPSPGNSPIHPLHQLLPDPCL